MISKEEVRELLTSTETYRIERTLSTGDKHKYQEAIYAYSKDIPKTKNIAKLLTIFPTIPVPSIPIMLNSIIITPTISLLYSNLFLFFSFFAFFLAIMYHLTNYF